MQTTSYLLLKYAIQQQQQLSHQLYASVRHSTPSPHGQPFGGPAEYAGQMPIMMPGAVMFGTPGGNQALTLFQQTLNHGRKLEGGDSSGVTLRSPLLDEFRANKSRKWELKVVLRYVGLHSLRVLMKSLLLFRTYSDTLLSLVGTSMDLDSYSKS